MSTRLVYVGPTTSGRSTSLCSVLRQSGAMPPSIVAYYTEYRATLPRGGEVLAAVSGVRSTNGYSTPAQGYVDPALRPEFDLLARADAIIFVVLSHSELLDVSAFHFNKLCLDLDFLGRDLRTLPVVFQANKQDWAAAPTLAEIREQFSAPVCSHVASIATRDIGTLEAVERAQQLRSTIV